MRLPAEAQKQRVHDALVSADGYVRAKELSEGLGVSKNTVYGAIRKLRQLGIGIHPAKKGYILSALATKSDDVNFLRKLNGRRTSDFIALSAARAFIEKRWAGEKDRQLLQSMVQPLNVDEAKLSISRKIIDDNLSILED